MSLLMALLGDFVEFMFDSGSEVAGICMGIIGGFLFIVVLAVCLSIPGIGWILAIIVFLSVILR